MLAAAATNLSVALGAGTVLVGSVGAILAVARFRTDEEGKNVSQQAQILEGMRGLNDELGEALTRARDDRDEWRKEATELRGTVTGLRDEVTLLHAEVVRLNEKLEAPS